MQELEDQVSALQTEKRALLTKGDKQQQKIADKERLLTEHEGVGSENKFLLFFYFFYLCHLSFPWEKEKSMWYIFNLKEVNYLKANRLPLIACDFAEITVI